MGNGRDGKPSDRRGGQWHHSKVTGGDVQPRKKPGAHPLTERLERERRQRATDTPALVPTPEAPAPGMGSDDEPRAKTDARARADASWDAVFELTVHGPAPAQNEAEPVQHVEGCEAGAPGLERLFQLAIAEVDQLDGFIRIVGDAQLHRDAEPSGLDDDSACLAPARGTTVTSWKCRTTSKGASRCCAV